MQSLKTRLPRNLLSPPSKDLTVSYVVPIAGELTNGNFFRLLKDLMRQGAARSSFELVLVVNNTQLAALQRDSLYRENERLMDLVEYVRGDRDELPPGLKPWQQRIVEGARTAGVQVQLLDHATRGIGMEVEVDIEKARTFGEHLALDRFAELGNRAHGGVVVLDADARVGRRTTQQIQARLDDPTMGKLEFQYDSVPGEGGRALFERNPEHRFSLAKRAAFAALHPVARGWHAMRASALEYGDPAKANGDLRDARQPTIGLSQPGEGILIHTVDRARQDGGGYGAGRFRELLVSRPAKAAEHASPLLTFLIPTYNNLVVNGAERQIRDRIAEVLQRTAGHLKDTTSVTSLVRAGLPIRENEFRDWSDALPRATASQHARALYELLDALLESGPTEREALERAVAQSVRREGLRHNLARANFERAFRRLAALERQLLSVDEALDALGIRGTASGDFVAQNAWVVSAFNQALGAAEYDVDRAWAILAQAFPEYLLPFEQTDETFGTALLRGIQGHLERAVLAPQSCPLTAQLSTRSAP